ncbi:MAG: hypothetical protein AAF845_03885 [Bacteroidota bacterium]
MGFLRLHVRYSLLVAFASSLLRYSVVAVVAVGVLVVLRRWRGAGPDEVRADLPEAVAIAFGLAIVMAAYRAWQRSRKRSDYYKRTRYN